MLDKWQQVPKRFNALSLRERLMLMAAVVVVFYQIADSLILTRQFSEIDSIRQSIAADRKGMTAVVLEVAEVTRKIQNDPNKALAKRLDKTKRVIVKTQAEIQKLAEQLVAPPEMAKMLEQLLLQQNDLQLDVLETLKARPLILSKKEVGNQELESSHEHQIYQHGFALEFSGTYLATLRYLELLETLPWKFYWDAVSLRVDKYPQNRVRLELHTLSLSEKWIGV